MNHSHTGQELVGTSPGYVEFVALMAFTMALVALSVDAMLPAFPEMGRDLLVDNVNDIQLVISVLFTGLALGQLFYGPLSDTTGRKPAIYAGFVVFILGSLVCMLTHNFYIMLAGRFLQGIGAAGPRVVAIALIRDRFTGSAMARVMSFIMTVFILVPIFAPALGQAVLLVAGWRAIFGTLVGLALATVLWIALRQPETLPVDQRLPFTLRKIGSAFLVVFRIRQAMVYTLITGCVSGAFFGYLNLCQQIFQVQYGLGTMFPLYFGILAVSVGAASLLNSTMVMRLGMHKLAKGSLLVMMILSWVFLCLNAFTAGHPPLWLFMLNYLALFFAIGVLFGNLNAIAMEPLGHVAGTGAAVIGSISTLLAVVLGYAIGHAYDGTLFSMAIGFASLTTVSMALTRLVKTV